NLLVKGCQRLVGTSAGTSAERTRHKVALRWPTVPERYFVGAHGRLRWARPKGASPASRASGYTRDVFLALDIPDGERTAACLRSIPQNSPSPALRSAHPRRARTWLASESDSSKPVPS